MILDLNQILIGIIGLFGGGVILFLVKRYFGGRDQRGKLNETNNANILHADADLRGDLIERVGILETRLDKLQDALTAQMVENATLKAENAALKKDNERQEAEITELRTFRRQDAGLIAELRAEVDALKLAVANYYRGKDTETLDVRLVDSEGNDK